jgi:S-adenosylmethionine synthetase
MDEFRDVVVVELKIGQGKEVLDVFELAGNEVVHANDVVAVFDKTIAQMRA